MIDLTTWKTTGANSCVMSSRYERKGYKSLTLKGQIMVVISNADVNGLSEQEKRTVRGGRREIAEDEDNLQAIVWLI